MAKFSPSQVAQSVGCSPIHQKVPGSIPGQGTYLGCGFHPGGSAYNRQLIDVSLSLSLKSINISLGED